MNRPLTPLLFTAAILLSACASTPGTAPGATSASGPAPAASAPVAAAPLAPPVTVPLASARKVVMTMTGPANVTQSKDWAEFKREWRETFADHAKAAGIAFSFVDTAPNAGAEDATLLTVDVADYRIVGIGARIMFGIMTGNAFIDAKVRYAALRNGTVYGEQQYNTSSSAGAGIFAKVTPQQVDAIATNVFSSLKAAK